MVSVGISDYPGSANDLHLSAKDAQTITWIYSKNSQLRYSLLLDEQATKAKIEAAMDKIFSSAGPDDMVIFFYSGHGYQGGFYVYDGGMDYSVIRRAMSKSKCRTKIVYADACFAGKLRENTRSKSASELKKAQNSNVMMFFSSRGNEVSYESSDLKNGYFTSYLQKGLRGGADKNGDRIITAKELYEFVNSNVVKYSNDTQHPVMYGKFSDNMPVLIW